MRKPAVVLLALMSLAVSAIPANAHTDFGAYCPYTAVSGTGDWTTRITPVSITSPNTMSISIDVTCISIFDEPLFHHFLLTGPSRQSCSQGQGTGTIQGFTPDGTVTWGTYYFAQIGIHYFIYGQYLAGEDEEAHWHNVYLWLDTIALCNFTHSDMIGHAFVSDGL